jgi:hypothetical protein
MSMAATAGMDASQGALAVLAKWGAYSIADQAQVNWRP